VHHLLLSFSTETVWRWFARRREASLARQVTLGVETRGWAGLRNQPRIAHPPFLRTPFSPASLADAPSPFGYGGGGSSSAGNGTGCGGWVWCPSGAILQFRFLQDRTGLQRFEISHAPPPLVLQFTAGACLATGRPALSTPPLPPLPPTSCFPFCRNLQVSWAGGGGGFTTVMTYDWTGEHGDGGGRALFFWVLGSWR
jgi:hypothetical protein